MSEWRNPAVGVLKGNRIPYHEAGFSYNVHEKLRPPLTVGHVAMSAYAEANIYMHVTVMFKKNTVTIMSVHHNHPQRKAQNILRERELLRWDHDWFHQTRQQKWNTECDRN